MENLRTEIFFVMKTSYVTQLCIAFRCLTPAQKKVFLKNVFGVRSNSKLHEVVDVCIDHFNDKEFEYAFAYTESKFDTIHALGNSTAMFTFNTAIGLLENVAAEALNKEELKKVVCDVIDKA